MSINIVTDNDSLEYTRVFRELVQTRELVLQRDAEIEKLQAFKAVATALQRDVASKAAEIERLRALVKAKDLLISEWLGE